VSVANNDTWQVQLPSRKRETALTITLVMLALLVILGGIGLTSLLVYVHQRNVASRAVPVSKPVLPSGQSPQMLYTRVTSTAPAFSDALTRSDLLLFTGTGDNCLSYSMSGLSLSSSSYNLGTSMCASSTAKLSNFAFQVKMTIVRGDEGGLLFRINTDPLNMCMFSIDTGGAFNVATFASPWTMLLHRSDPAIKVGLGQSNVLTVIGLGQTVLLYTNDHYLGQVTSANISPSGGIGLVAYDLADPTTIVFSNLRLWKL
jgi:hypothetical protein